MPPAGEQGGRDPAPLASIVICAHGKRDYTERCLATLERALGSNLGESFELVLVDNASPDSTLELFERWSARARIVALPRNHNFAGGNNRGAEAARGEVLVFLNNDTEVPRGALEPLVEEARTPEVGVVGARLLYPNGRIQHAGVVFRGVPSGTALPLHLFHHAPGDLPLARTAFDLDATTGACFVMRRALFRDLGGFDEAYVNGLEDIDLCVRVRLGGYRIVYRGDVAIIHRERVTRGTKHDESRNASVFMRRWGSVCGDDDDTLENLFGARFTPHRRIIAVAQPLPDGTGVEFSGELDSVCPEGAEGRALLWLAAVADLNPALRDAPPVFTNVQPRFGDDVSRRLDDARRRVARPDATRVHVPSGDLWTAAARDDLIRAGCVPRHRLRDHQILLVPSHALRDRLVASGLASERVEVLRSAISSSPVTGGGAGVLALVPSHERDRTRWLLTALRRISTDVALLPSVRAPWLERAVDELAPSAQLLSPVTDEAAWAELAGRHDVVVTATETDGFERRALVAAARGTAAVSRSGGPAAEILCEGLDVSSESDTSELVTAIEAALDARTARAGRAERITEACSASVVGPRLVELVGGGPEISLAELEQDAAEPLGLGGDADRDLAASR